MARLITNEEVIEVLYDIIDNSILDDDIKDKILEIANMIDEE